MPNTNRLSNRIFWYLQFIRYDENNENWSLVTFNNWSHSSSDTNRRLRVQLAKYYSSKAEQMFAVFIWNELRRILIRSIIKPLIAASVIISRNFAGSSLSFCIERSADRKTKLIYLSSFVTNFFLSRSKPQLLLNIWQLCKAIGR